MATKKIMSAFVALFVMVCGIVVLTSCQADSESIRTELAAPKTVEVEKTVLVEKDKLVYLLNNVWFDGKTMSINDYVALTADVNHSYPTIEMPAADHAAANITDANELSWRDSNGQLTKGTLTQVASKDGSYHLFAALTPAANYSSITSVHPKVSVVTTHHTLEGRVEVISADETKSKDFSFDLARHYLLVDPSVDVQVIEKTDTLEKLVVKTDTVVVEKEVEKVVTVTDTLTVEVEKFVKGADVHNVVVNGFGSSTGTLTMGDKQLLQVTVNHKDPVLNVSEDKLGNVTFSNVSALRWDGSDNQVTTGTQQAQSVNVKGFNYVRNEYTTILEGSLVMVRTIYNVWGTFTNENGDICNFEMELAPSYLQKFEAAPTPQVEKPMYRGIIRKVSAEGLKLMTKPIVQKWNGTAWEDVRTCSRSCIGMSGSPSGLDLFVKSAKIIEETENSWNYSGNDATWAGDDTKSDGTIITKRTKVYEFNHMFEADAVNNGKVGPATQLYVMKAERVQVLDPENNLLTCTWEDGSEFSLNISVVLNNTEFVEKAELKGQTRKESDKTYKYLTSFVQHFTATVGGQKLQDVDAVSTLWVPVQ